MDTWNWKTPNDVYGGGSNMALNYGGKLADTNGLIGHNPGYQEIRSTWQPYTDAQGNVNLGAMVAAQDAARRAGNTTSLSQALNNPGDRQYYNALGQPYDDPWQVNPAYYQGDNGWNMISAASGNQPSAIVPIGTQAPWQGSGGALNLNNQYNVPASGSPVDILASMLNNYNSQNSSTTPYQTPSSVINPTPSANNQDLLSTILGRYQTGIKPPLQTYAIGQTGNVDQIPIVPLGQMFPNNPSDEKYITDIRGRLFPNPNWWG